MKKLLFFLFVIYAFTLQAEPYRDINVQRIGVEQGLSHYTVNSIYQDEFGFIWVGTMDGLNRYNGKKMDIFKPHRNDSLSISENNIRFICGDGQGRLFIKGLERVSQLDLRTNTFTIIRESGVRAISYGNDRLWMAVGGILHRHDPRTEESEVFFSFRRQGFPDAIIASFIIARDGSLCISTVRNGYFRVDPNGTIRQHIPAGEANSLLEDSRQNIWIATRTEGLYCIPEQGAIEHYAHSTNPYSLNHNNVRSICEDDDGDFFVGTYDGLCKLDRTTGKFTHYRYEFVRAAFNIRSIITMIRDRQGTLWIGTFYEGLHCYNTAYDTYRYYYPSMEVPGRLTSPIVSSVVEDRHGTLWLGTEGGGLNALDRATNSFRSYRQGNGPRDISSDVVKSLLYDPGEDVLWIATLYDGINRMDLRTGEVRRTGNRIYDADGDYSGNTENIVKMRFHGDSILLATNKGVVVMDKKTFRMTRFDTGFSPNYRAQAWDLKFDPDGNLWVTYSTDLLKVSPGSQMTKRYVLGDIISSKINNNMNFILQDSRGRMWFGSTGSGVFLYHKETDNFTNYSAGEGLGNNYVTGLAEDPRTGAIYISTNGGLSRLDPQSGNIHNYNTRNGFPLTVINDNSLYVTRDSELFACGLSGMISVKADELRNSARDYDVYIPEIVVNNRRVQPGDESRVLGESMLYQQKVKLKAAHSVITFEFASNDFLNAAHSGMTYKLEGFDAGFIEANENNYATYTNLNPGRYTFIARGGTPDTRGEYPESRVELTVMPPFYKAWWFMLGVVLLAATLIFFLVKAYNERVRLRSSLALEKQEREHTEAANQSKFRFFTNVSHEFRTPLTLINSQLELLLQQQNLKPATYSRILSAYKNSRRMRRLVDEIIDLRKQEQGYMKLKISELDFSAFLEEIFLSFKEYAAHHSIEYTFRNEASSVRLVFDPEQMEKVVYNLLSNAFKYTSPGNRIELSLEQAGEEIVVRVTDNGLGVSPQHIARIFERFYQDDEANAQIAHNANQGSGVGLALTKAIVEMHGGTIDVESQPNVRTAFTVRFPTTPQFDSEHVVHASYIDQQQYIIEYREAETEAGEKKTAAASDARILIVEDNDEVREMLVQIFEPVYRVDSAKSGEEGIAKARELQPDIILSDIMMPGMSGVEMCGKLKSGFETGHIPIVLLTARNAEEHIVEGLLTGADDYITKPFNVKLLVARCNNLVAGRRRLQEKYRKQPEADVQMLSTNPADQQLLTRAVEIVTTHLDNVDFDIHTFSREMGLSRTYLFAKIKGLTGQTPNEFVLNLRLKRAAARLVSAPAASLSDIAYETGFSSPSYFIKCFKGVYGKTPNMYRKSVLEGEP